MIFINDVKNKNFVDFLQHPKPCELQIIGNLESITPLIVTMELTNKCNFKCRYCYGDCSIYENKNLANPVAILSYLSQSRVYGIELSGGEPFMHPQICDILRFIVNHFEVKAILTNGTLITKEHLNILEKNKKGKIAIQICLDGSNEKSVDIAAGVKGAFKRIIKGINLVKKYNLPFKVGMVVDHPDKISEIEDTLILAKNLGADLFVASPLFNIGRGTIMADNFTPEDNVCLFDEIKRMQLKYKGFFQIVEDKVSFENAKNCGMGSKNLTVDFSGNLKPCPVSNFNYHIGKWNELHSERIQNKLKLFVDLDKPNSKDCNDCNFINYCSGCITKGITKAVELNDRCEWFVKNKKVLIEIMEMH